MPKNFSPELRDRAVRIVYDRHALEGGPRAQSIRAVAPQLGVGEETLRIWCNRYGPAEGTSRPQESLEEENRRLRRELAETRRANDSKHCCIDGLSLSRRFSQRSSAAPQRNDPAYRRTP